MQASGGVAHEHGMAAGARQLHQAQIGMAQPVAGIEPDPRRREDEPRPIEQGAAHHDHGLGIGAHRGAVVFVEDDAGIFGQGQEGDLVAGADDRLDHAPVEALAPGDDGVVGLTRGLDQGQQSRRVEGGEIGAQHGGGQFDRHLAQLDHQILLAAHQIVGRRGRQGVGRGRRTGQAEGAGRQIHAWTEIA